MIDKVPQLLKGLHPDDEKAYLGNSGKYGLFTSKVLKDPLDKAYENGARLAAGEK